MPTPTCAAPALDHTLLLPSGGKYRAILLFGAPGSGKGTQGRLLGKTPGFFHCACGDVFRSLDAQSDLGREFMDYSARGELVPDDLTLRLWQKSLADHVRKSVFRPAEQWLVLDGIPRNRTQAREMNSFLEVSRLFHLQCADPAVLENRLHRRAAEAHRPDDRSREVVRHRLALFARESAGVLESYPAATVRTVDASAPPGEVLAEVLRQIPGRDASPARPLP